MPPPKRPFTTSSLTSTLKSTIASQPLLSNLTNIDKLSSQASSFAQKSPFFANLTNQQHNPQQTTTNNAQQVSGNLQQNQQQPASGSISGAGDMMRTGNQQNNGQTRAQPTAAAVAAPPNAPSVDMSHLTEEERLMIQSVMAKAEMADMGIPVDTSAPSSTNLPSNASQALVQQQNQARQQQQQARLAANQAAPARQQQATQQPSGQIMLDSQNPASFAQQQYQQQQQQQLNMNMLAGPNQTEAGYSQQIGNAPQSHLQQQQQFNQSQFNQQPIYQNLQRADGTVEQQQQQVAQQAQSMEAASRGALPSLEQQTQQLVNQINSQFNLNQQPHQTLQTGPSQAQLQFNANRQQQHQSPADQLVSSERLVAQQMSLQQQQISTRLNESGLAEQTIGGAQLQTNANQMAARQQMAPMQQNQIMQQAAFSVAERQQVPSQQQQQQVNVLPGVESSVAMLQQANQMDFSQQDPAALLLAARSAQMAAAGNNPNLVHQQQQLPGSTGMQYNSGQLINMVPNQQQMQMTGLNANLNESNLASFKLSQQQRGIAEIQVAEMMANQQGGLQYATTNKQLISANEPNQQQVVNEAPGGMNPYDMSPYQQSSQQIQQQQLVVNPARESPYSQHDPRDDIRFRQQVAFESDYYNDLHALSDQENQSRERHLARRQQSQQTGGRLGLRRYDSAEPQGKSDHSRSSPRSGCTKKEALVGGTDIQRDRSLQAYDLAGQLGSGSRQQQPTKTRHLPQPTSRGQASHSFVSKEQQFGSADQRQRALRSATGKQLQQQRSTVRPRLAPQRAHSTRQDSPYLSASDDELAETEDLEAEEEEERNIDARDEEEEVEVSDEMERDEGAKKARTKRQAKDAKGRNKETGQVAKVASVASGKSDTGTDKSEEAMRLLSEFKLTEQATQVMEQQQLLIKQGQELIKLQLEQQALSQELKKSLNKSPKEDDLNKSASSDRIKGETLAGKSEETKDERGSPSGQQFAARGGGAQAKSDDLPDELSGELTSKKSTSLFQQSRVDSDDTAEESPSRLASSMRSNPSKTKSHFEDNSRHSGTSRTAQFGATEIGPDRLGSNKERLAGSSGVQSAAARYNRDLLQSPTDTTDSDIEPLTQANLRRRQQQKLLSPGAAHNKPKGPAVASRRREPTGLPPSPLPVAAAIQLHQMQQQHFRQARGGGQSTGASGLSRTTTSNFMRSRSVTSSPNHHLTEHTNSGYLTDLNQRIRSTSPDTLSEFGGQRRRKRLPEPPSNLVPITPSMVRKMIQAQRAGGAPAARLPTSVNAQTTLLTNTHSTRSGAFERPPPAEGNLAGRSTHLTNQTGGYQPTSQAPNSSMFQQDGSLSGGYKRPQQHLGAGNPTYVSGASESQSVAPSQIQSHVANSDLNKFLSSTYGNSILRNNNISDVKETPELDKLISNLDDYYNLDNGAKRTVQLSSDNLGTSRLSDLYNPAANSSLSASYDLLGASSAAASAPTATASYLQHSSGYPARSAASHQLGDLETAALTRRYSEGEDGPLANRLASKRSAYFRPGASNYDGDYTSRLMSSKYSTRPTNATNPSYLNGALASSADNYLTGHSSPVRQSAPGIRFGGSQTGADRLRDSYQPTIGGADQSWRASTTSNYYSRPLSQAQSYHLSNRAPLMSTGSLDLKASEPAASSYSSYLGSDQRSAFALPQADSSQQRSAAYSTHIPARYPNTIDSLRDRYRDRYTTNGSASKYGRSDNNSSLPRISGSHLTGEYGDPSQRSYLAHSGAPSLSQLQQHRSFDLDSRRTGYGTNLRSAAGSSVPFEPIRSRAGQYSDFLAMESSGSNYLGARGESTISTTADQSYGSYNIGQTSNYTRPKTGYTSDLSSANRLNSSIGSSFAPFTKDDIINNGPKFNSIGYRFRTENQNKYVAQNRAPIQNLQTRYPHPYKRILLSKNPKDRIGNGIGVRINGGQPIPSLYDKVNGCIITSGAFVTEIFQNSNVYFMGEMQEGDQIIEWNGVNLCNRSYEEVQQILLSQLSDDEVEIVFLHLEHFNEAYNEVTEANEAFFMFNNQRDGHEKSYAIDKNQLGQQEEQYRRQMRQQHQPDPFDMLADMNKPGHQRTISPLTAANYNRGRHYSNEASKGSIRRKISLSSIAHIWSAK